MKFIRLSSLASLLFLALVSCQTEQSEAPMSEMYAKAASSDLPEPVAKQVEKRLEIHGDVRIDKYYWMNQREDPEVIAHLEAENAYREEVMSHLQEYQDKLFEELKGRIKQTDMSVPYKDNGYYYFTRYEEGKEYPIYSRKKGSLNAEEEVMLDLNSMSEGYDYYSVSGRSVSPDNKILAFGEDTLSRRIYTLRFKNLET
ncbi:MAG: oligopeptidase B, partial [Saprospiraceae bacterium]|nr:oligopeptidase B [Saprospiraceae bacterium]